jgi:hypothetical protein
MDAADQGRVLKRVTEILDLCEAGTYSAAISPRIKTRNENAIADFVTEAGFKVLEMLATLPNEYRGNYLVPTPLNYQDLLPDHQGQPASVDIMPYPEGPWQPGAPLNYQKIDSYRALGKIYDPSGIPHNVKGSSLAGYYDIWEQRFYFTGMEALLGLAIITRADVATKVPAIMENTWIRLAVGESAKSGTGQYDMGVVAFYGQKGDGDMTEFANGRRTFSEVSDPEPTGEVHQQ